MGGGKASPPSPGSVAGDEDSSLDQDSSQLSSPLLRSELSMEDEDGAVDKDSRSGSVFRDYGTLRDWEAKERMRETVYRKIMQSGELSSVRGKHLKEAKDKILSYTPGAWIETTGGMKRRDYDVPKTTTLLLVGPKGSGKSSLINRISKMFEDDKFASERAQVSYNSSVGDGTLFLREYMMPRGSTSFCIYDSRSLSGDSVENIGMLRHWMVDGVRHGELAIRDSDSQSWRTAMIHEAHEKDHLSSAIRKGIASMYNCRFLAFKDDKPAVVITHGDLLSHDERAHVRVHLGELLGIPPTTQIFDIPESSDPVTDSTTTDMLCYSLEHAEKNFTNKKKVFTISHLPCMLLLMLLGTAINLWCMYHHAHIQQFPSTQSGIEHCQCPQTHFQHCHYPHGYIQHDHGLLSGEHNIKKHLPEEHIEQDPLPEEHIQQDLFPQEQIQQDTFLLEQVQQEVFPQGQVQQDSLPLEQVQQDTFPQEQVQQISLPQDHLQQDLLPQHHVQHDPLPQMHIVKHDCVALQAKCLALQPLQLPCPLRLLLRLLQSLLVRTTALCPRKVFGTTALCPEKVFRMPHCPLLPKNMFIMTLHPLFPLKLHFIMVLCLTFFSMIVALQAKCLLSMTLQPLQLPCPLRLLLRLLQSLLVIRTALCPMKVFRIPHCPLLPKNLFMMTLHPVFPLKLHFILVLCLTLFSMIVILQAKCLLSMALQPLQLPRPLRLLLRLLQSLLVIRTALFPRKVFRMTASCPRKVFRTTALCPEKVFRMPHCPLLPKNLFIMTLHRLLTHFNMVLCPECKQNLRKLKIKLRNLRQNL